MKITFILIIVALCAITLAQRKSNAFNCAGCSKTEQLCISKCNSETGVSEKLECIKTCTTAKSTCFDSCNKYKQCKLSRQKLIRECKVIKSSGIQYVKNIKALYKKIVSHKKTNKRALIGGVAKKQQRDLAQARSFAKKYFQCKKRLTRLACARPCVSRRCLKRRKCLFTCRESLIKCKSGCSALKGKSAEVKCSAKCYSTRNLCRKDCHTTCGQTCKTKRQCKIQCKTQFKNKISKHCTKNVVPICQRNCTPKCNKKCSMRDNEKCLLICAATCAHGCYASATRICVKRSQMALRVCKKRCSHAKCQVVKKCGDSCLSNVRGRFSKCATQNKSACPKRCNRLCSSLPCKTVKCQADCAGVCNKSCFWLQRKTCHIFTTPKFRKCLRRCPGWCPYAEKTMVAALAREQLGSNHGRCHKNCSNKKVDDTVKCFMKQRHKCPRKCSGICKQSKCTTDGCRERCSTKCTNTCYILLKKKCSLLAQGNALTCLKKCK